MRSSWITILLVACAHHHATNTEGRLQSHVKLADSIPSWQPGPIEGAATVAPSFTATIGAGAQGGEASAWLLPMVPCEQGECRVDAVSLGPTSAAELRGFVDLLGDPASISPQSGGGDDLFGDGGGGRSLAASLPPAAKFPAAVIDVTRDTEYGSMHDLMLVALAGPAHGVIFSTGIRLDGKDGGGYHTINTIDLDRESGQAADTPLVIHFAQTSMPRSGDKPYRPGPPEEQVWKFDGSAYKQAR
jgi:hypothetical protein